ncbi:MAG: hypothetical protein IPJ33_06485 [Gammaproteobacteria bacterium]|jgi:hypothetical protein|nr:hypothetical protein [Gammaproteobacteria bacterium]MBP6051082.1 hypothetical protein [Pseudomonadales bacterium]MBK6584186.1 hypothetical protein [Gammaproteobacteria bacterium]MBK7168563.1 hypothetical protein [Gammaproteobacteria bacterium]MBK7520370.1 hypothetical protein [Gammaproteobacteria bacterium]
MAMSMRKQSVQFPVQQEPKSATLESIFDDPRAMGKRRADRIDAAASGEESGGLATERRGSHSLQVGGCWWLQRNYLTVEAKLFVTEQLLCPAQSLDA